MKRTSAAKLIEKLSVWIAAGLMLNTGVQAQDGSLVSQFMANPAAVDPPALSTSGSRRTGAEPVITANGIMNILGPWQVLFKVTEGGSPGQPSKESTYILGEGQSRDDIEVMRIDRKAGLVTFKNHGKVQEISLAAVPASAEVIMQPEALTHSAPGRIPSYLAADGDTGNGAAPAPKTPDEQMRLIEAKRAYYNRLGDPESKRLARSLPPTALTPPDAFATGAENP